MFGKGPNYHFSRQKNREISSTEAQISKFRHRMSSITKRRERNQVRPAPMSQPAVGQSQKNEPIGGDSCGTPNGIGSESYGGSTSHGGSVHTDTPHFGLFHDQIQNEVEKLQGGLGTVSGAIVELTKAFVRHGEIVKVVGDRWGKDQELEEQIHDLKAINAGIWKNIEQDRETYNKNKSDSERKHADEISMLQEKADAGEQEKKKYEEMERHRKDEHNTAMQSLETELNQRKTQLEVENAEKISTLEREKRELENANAKLEQQLKEMTKERDQEKDTRVTMQKKLWKDNEELQNKLRGIEAKYQVDKKPSQFYLDQYHVLTDSMGNIARAYFTNLPDKAIDEPVATSTQLRKKSPIFAKTPIANSDCSQVLRLANAQHIIFNVICGSLWQPFFSKYLWKHKRDRSTITEIYSGLAAFGEDFQQNWKIATLKMLDQLDDAVDVGEQLDDLIEDKIIALLQPLLDDSQADHFKVELKALLTDAIELGRKAERDQSPVYTDWMPTLSDRDGWKEYLSEEYDPSDVSDLSATSPTMDIAPEPLFVSPKIFRRAAKMAKTAIATMSATATATNSPANQPEVEVIQAGLALFPSTGIFQEGAVDWQRISSAGREAARSTSGKARRPSRSMSMTSSVVMSRSPQQPSKRWSREGTQDFD